MLKVVNGRRAVNIYKNLNAVTQYLDDNLEEKIEYDIVAKMMGTNVYTAQRIFAMIAGMSLSEYVRKRRLSSAGHDLCVGGLRVIDIAAKYQYGNATSFSRAFEKFHGVKPSAVKDEMRLRDFPRMIFDEEVNVPVELEYEVVNLGEMNLCGVGMSTNNSVIGKDAPRFFDRTEQKYLDKYGRVNYGMITYDSDREHTQKYYCLYEQSIDGFEHVELPKSKWLKFRIDSQIPEEIQKASNVFYEKFFPSMKYDLRQLPELEYYHDDVTDFLVAIN